MICFDSGGCLLQDASELPQVPGRIERLYADFETTSGDKSEDATSPWHHCQAIGASVAFDDGPVWFVPKELLVTGWWRDVVRNTAAWVNHNVKYDAHVSANDLSVIPRCALVCTLTGAKLVDSDRVYKGGYGLDVLAKQWLQRDIDEYHWRMTPYLHRNKDYGQIPIDVLAEYACVDTQVARDLDAYLRREIPDESQDVWRTEQRVTGLLFEIEREGVRVDPVDLQKTQLLTLHKMLKLDEELEVLVKRSFNPNSPDDLHDVLCNQFGLPVLGYTESGNPSFDKDVLKLYLNHPDAPSEIVEKILAYKSLSTFNSLFLNKWGELNVGGVMHPTYNQCVRTGRMSCSDPNMQQLKEEAKHLIIPPEGYGIVQSDFSQIEFRFIVHYLENKQCIAAYQQDPWTDFHQWVADMVPTKRKPAKTINFMMGYGGGKKKTIEVLSVNKEVVGDVIEELGDVREEARASAIRRACEQRALQVYDKYHKLLPELKPSSRLAGDVCRRRGYARNHYGRRRHLPTQASHVAFNSVCQSSAGDLMKERMVALRDEVPELKQIAQVHDQVLGIAPLELLERDDTLLRRIVDVMCAPARPLRVPVRATIGWSPRSWAHAQSDERERKLV